MEFWLTPLHSDVNYSHLKMFGLFSLVTSCMLWTFVSFFLFFFYITYFYSSSNIKKIGSSAKMFVLILRVKGSLLFWFASMSRYFSYSFVSKFAIFLKQFCIKLFCLLPRKSDLFRFEIKVTSAPNW